MMQKQNPQENHKKGSYKKCSVSVILSTLFDRKKELKNMLRSLQAQTLKPRDVCISVQASTKEKQRNFEDYISSLGLDYPVNTNFQRKKNLSYGRNKAIEMAEGDVIVVCDDDCIYGKKAVNHISKLYSKDATIDVLCFDYCSREEASDNKGFDTVIRQITYPDIFNIASVEISFKSNMRREFCEIFDEEFGLGARYPSSEETIFLHDSFCVGKNIYKNNSCLVSHDYDDKDDRLSNERFFSKGALFKRIHGRAGLLFLLVFVLKKSWELGSLSECPRKMFFALKGYIDYSG